MRSDKLPAILLQLDGNSLSVCRVLKNVLSLLEELEGSVGNTTVLENTVDDVTVMLKCIE